MAAAASAKPVAHSARAVAPIRALGARASNRWPALGPKLAADPDLQRAYIDNQLLQQGLVYGPSLRAAGLPPDKAQRFMEFVHESLWNQMDIKLAGESLGLQPDDPAVSSLTMESRLNFQAQAAQEFPPGEFARFQGGVEELFELGPFAGSLYDTGDPLTLGQADKLTQMIAQANPETLNDWTGVVQQAPAILAPSQLSAFQALTTFLPEPEVPRRAGPLLDLAGNREQLAKEVSTLERTVKAAERKEEVCWGMTRMPIRHRRQIMPPPWTCCRRRSLFMPVPNCRRSIGRRNLKYSAVLRSLVPGA